MKAIYQEKPNCAPCIDIYGPDIASECKHCMELHRYEVEVLQLDVGLFADKAVIQKEDGSLKKVPLSALTMKGETTMLKPGCCPVCGYKFEKCQCRFSGSAHPDRSKRIAVISDHLYLLTPSQLAHFMFLQTNWEISYDDPEKMDILKELKGETDGRSSETGE